MIIPGAVATGGWLHKPLGIVSDGYITLAVVPVPPLEGGGPGTARQRVARDVHMDPIVFRGRSDFEAVSRADVSLVLDIASDGRFDARARVDDVVARGGGGSAFAATPTIDLAPRVVAPAYGRSRFTSSPSSFSRRGEPRRLSDEEVVALVASIHLSSD